VQVVAQTLAYAGAAHPAAVAYVCGMTAMVEEVRSTLARAGIPPGQVHANF
jgi:ferredoxin-NADP reductase